MKAALLCPGPSLLRTWADDFEGLTIGVNRAPTAFSCDVWAALDCPRILATSGQIKGSPALLTRVETAAALANHGWSWRAPIITVESFAGFCPPELRWDLFTRIASLVLAAFRGAGEILCYGDDRSGQADFDGDRTAERRTDARWLQESAIDGPVVQWLAGRGVRVQRIF